MEMNFFYGEDVGYPGSYGGFAGDAVKIYAADGTLLDRARGPGTYHGVIVIVKAVRIPNAAHGGGTVGYLISLIRNDEWNADSDIIFYRSY